jgi:uncharacterized RDD family membrane protein YckC
MKILKLKIVKASNGLQPGVDEVFLRALFSFVSGFLLLGYAWALIDKEKRTWHDIISGTKIIRL